MSKSIHTTIASTRRNNSLAELDDPDNADVASLAKKIGYKKAERRKRQGSAEAAVNGVSAKPGRAKA